MSHHQIFQENHTNKQLFSKDFYWTIESDCAKMDHYGILVENHTGHESL